MWSFIVHKTFLELQSETAMEQVVWDSYASKRKTTESKMEGKDIIYIINTQVRLITHR